MVKNGISTTVNTRHQCITVMKEYDSKSFEVGLFLHFCMFTKFCQIPLIIFIFVLIIEEKKQNIYKYNVERLFTGDAWLLIRTVFCDCCVIKSKLFIFSPHQIKPKSKVNFGWLKIGKQKLRKCTLKSFTFDEKILIELH